MANVTTDKVQELLAQGEKVHQIASQFNVSRQAIYCHINKLKKKNTPKPSSFKKKNYIIDWRIYNEGLVRRGEILFDFSLFNNWNEELELMNENKRGRPYKYPSLFLLFLLQLKCIFKIDYRTLEGISRKLIAFTPHNERAPDYTTLQIRLKNSIYELKVYEQAMEQELAADSTGLKTSNRGEYRMNRYRGERKKYVKLHIAVNIKTKQVVGLSLTPEEVRDHKELPNIIAQAGRQGKIKRVLLDKGYDSKYTYLDLKKEGITPIIKPRKSMSLERVATELRGLRLKRGNLEDEARILRLSNLKSYLEDKEKWKKDNEFGERWKSEGRYSVFKRIFGEHIFSKRLGNMRNEVTLKVGLMNLFASLVNGAISKRDVEKMVEFAIA